MRHFRKITLFENKRRVQYLIDFENDIIGYFNTLQNGKSWLTINDMIENEDSFVFRQKINLKLDEAGNMILATGQRAMYLYADAPVAGGRRTALGLLENVFLLTKLEISPQNLIDTIERAIGIYQNDFRAARRRTFNPVFWFGLALDYVASLPFRLLGKLGFNQRRAEESVLGRLVKSLLYLITVVAALLTILDLLGYIGGVKEWVQANVGAEKPAPVGRRVP